MVNPTSGDQLIVGQWVNDSDSVVSTAARDPQTRGDPEDRQTRQV